MLGLLAVALLAAPGTARAQETAGTDAARDSTAIIAVVERFHQALVAGDSATALSLLADDAVILEGGGLETRAEYRRHHMPADMAFAAAVPAEPWRDLKVTVSGNAAWIASTNRREGTFRGRDIAMAGAELVVLRRGDSGWKIAAIHWSSRADR